MFMDFYFFVPESSDTKFGLNGPIVSQEMTLTFHIFNSSVSCLHLSTFKSQASIVSEKKSTVYNFSYKKNLSYQI